MDPGLYQKMMIYLGHKVTPGVSDQVAEEAEEQHQLHQGWTSGHLQGRSRRSGCAGRETPGRWNQRVPNLLSSQHLQNHHQVFLNLAMALPTYLTKELDHLKKRSSWSLNQKVMLRTPQLNSLWPRTRTTTWTMLRRPTGATRDIREHLA